MIRNDEMNKHLLHTKKLNHRINQRTRLFLVFENFFTIKQGAVRSVV